jgi:hypothetical protein
MSDAGVLESSSRFVSAKEAAEFLGFKRITLAHWRSKPDHPLRFHRAGLRVRYKIADLLKFQEHCSKDPNKKPLREAKPSSRRRRAA